MTSQLIVDPLERLDILKSLASEVRVRILELLTRKGPHNVNQVAAELDLPQSTVSAEHPGPGRRRPRPDPLAEGAQGQPEDLPLDLLRAAHRLQGRQSAGTTMAAIDVAMPLGLYTRCEVTAPCGLCSTDGVIGLLDVPDTFLDPDRMRAGLLWFTRGFVEYQFPNNAKLLEAPLARARALAGAFLRGPRHLQGLALRHHRRDQRPGDRHLDLARRLRRQARRPTRPPGGSSPARSTATSSAGASPPHGTFRDGARVSAAIARRPRPRQPPLDPGPHRRQGRRPPSRRHQHLRPRLRQPRPGHRAAPRPRLTRTFP